MGKRGPKRKEGVREANGQLSRRPLNAADRHKAKVEKETWDQICVVVNQPHRRDAANPEDKRLSSALGRFCRQHGLREGYMAGAEAWAVTKRRWLVAVAGKPKGYENITAGPTREGASEEQIGRWKDRLDEVDRSLRSQPAPALGLVYRLAVDDIDVLSHQQVMAPQIIAILGEIAVVMGCLERNPHPFKS